MDCTAIPVMHRDDDNYKTYGWIVLDGTITAAQTAELAGALSGGDRYIPGQLDLGSLDYDGRGPDWHEMLLDQIEILPSNQTVALNGVDRDHRGTIADFIATVKAVAAKGWDPHWYEHDN